MSSTMFGEASSPISSNNIEATTTNPSCDARRNNSTTIGWSPTCGGQQDDVFPHSNNSFSKQTAAISSNSSFVIGAGTISPAPQQSNVSRNSPTNSNSPHQQKCCTGCGKEFRLFLRSKKSCSSCHQLFCGDCVIKSSHIPLRGNFCCKQCNSNKHFSANGQLVADEEYERHANSRARAALVIGDGDPDDDSNNNTEQFFEEEDHEEEEGVKNNSAANNDSMNSNPGPATAPSSKKLIDDVAEDVLIGLAHSTSPTRNAQAVPEGAIINANNNMLRSSAQHSLDHRLQRCSQASVGSNPQQQTGLRGSWRHSHNTAGSNPSPRESFASYGSGYNNANSPAIQSTRSSLAAGDRGLLSLPQPSSTRSSQCGGSATPSQQGPRELLCCCRRGQLRSVKHFDDHMLKCTVLNISEDGDTLTETLLIKSSFATSGVCGSSNSVLGGSTSGTGIVLDAAAATVVPQQRMSGSQSPTTTCESPSSPSTTVNSANSSNRSSYNSATQHQQQQHGGVIACDEVLLQTNSFNVLREAVVNFFDRSQSLVNDVDEEVRKLEVVIIPSDEAVSNPDDCVPPPTAPLETLLEDEEIFNKAINQNRENERRQQEEVQQQQLQSQQTNVVQLRYVPAVGSTKRARSKRASKTLSVNSATGVGVIDSPSVDYCSASGSPVLGSVTEAPSATAAAAAKTSMKSFSPGGSPTQSFAGPSQQGGKAAKAPAFVMDQQRVLALEKELQKERELRLEAEKKLSVQQPVPTVNTAMSSVPPQAPTANKIEFSPESSVTTLDVTPSIEELLKLQSKLKQLEQENKTLKELQAGKPARQMASGAPLGSGAVVSQLPVPPQGRHIVCTAHDTPKVLKCTKHVTDHLRKCTSLETSFPIQLLAFNITGNAADDVLEKTTPMSTLLEGTTLWGTADNEAELRVETDRFFDRSRNPDCEQLVIAPRVPQHQQREDVKAFVASVVAPPSALAADNLHRDPSMDMLEEATETSSNAGTVASNSGGNDGRKVIVCQSCDLKMSAAKAVKAHLLSGKCMAPWCSGPHGSPRFPLELVFLQEGVNKTVNRHRFGAQCASVEELQMRSQEYLHDCGKVYFQSHLVKQLHVNSSSIEGHFDRKLRNYSNNNQQSGGNSANTTPASNSNSKTPAAASPPIPPPTMMAAPTANMGGTFFIPQQPMTMVPANATPSMLGANNGMIPIQASSAGGSAANQPMAFAPAPGQTFMQPPPGLQFAGVIPGQPPTATASASWVVSGNNASAQGATPFVPSQPAQQQSTNQFLPSTASLTAVPGPANAGVLVLNDDVWGANAVAKQ